MDRKLHATLKEYVGRGWAVIPVPYRSKNPDRAGWQQLRLTTSDLDRYFPGQQWNVGVLLGEPSGWLIDVDLDHALAVELVPEYLPDTNSIFGRAGKRRSHWLYRTSPPTTTKQWRLPSRKMIVELRSTGDQTVFPGSVHPPGESIVWDQDGEPAVIDPSQLKCCIETLVCEVRARLGVALQDEGTTRPSAVISTPQPVIQHARAYLAKLPPAISGQGGHDAAFRAACRLVIGFGLDGDQALSLLQEWNDRCQPPWSTKELQHKVEDAMKQPGWRGHLLSQFLVKGAPSSSAIDRANRHAVEHKRRSRRRAHA